MRRRVLAVLFVVAVSASSRAGDPQEPTYADKPASWWVAEFVAGEDSEAARAVLRRMGDAAAPEIAAALAGAKSPQVRCKLLELLAAVTKLPDSVVTALRPSLASADTREQAGALRVVARAGTAAASLADDVAALVDSPSADVRRHAVVALSALGDAAVPYVPALAAAIGDGDERSDFPHVVALGRIGPRAGEALPSLLEFAASRPPHATVVRALNSVGPDDARVAAEIVRAVETGDGHTRENLNAFLSEPRPAGNAFLAAAGRLAGNDDRAVRVAVAGGLGHAAKGRSEVPATLFLLLGDDDIGVAAGAARVLEECGPADHSIAVRVGEVWLVTRHPNAMTSLILSLLPESGPALIAAALSDRDDLRQAAWHVLARVGEGGIGADAGEVKRLLFDSRAGLRHRETLLSIVLSQNLLAPEVARDVCAAIVTEGEPALAARAAHALTSVPEQRSALITAAARPEPIVRAAALAALGPSVAKLPDACEACVRAAEDDEPAVRSAALRALQFAERQAWSGTSDSRDLLVARMPKLIGLGVDERRAVIGLLSNFPDAARPAGPLVAMLAHDDVVEPAIALLSRTPADPGDLLRPLLDGDDPLAAARAARVALARRADAAIVAKLAGWIESKDVRVAHEAAIAAAGLPRDVLIELGGALVRAARAGVEGVAWPACSALSRIAGSEPVARDALLAVADDPKNSAQIAVVPLLPALGEPGIVRLVAFLDHTKRDARRSACTVILSAAHNGQGDYAAAVPALERLAKGDDLELARLATQALEKIRR